MNKSKREWHLFGSSKVLGEFDKDPSREVIKYYCEVCGEKTYQIPIMGGEPEENYYQCPDCGEIYNYRENEYIPDPRQSNRMD